MSFLRNLTKITCIAHSSVIMLALLCAHKAYGANDPSFYYEETFIYSLLSDKVTCTDISYYANDQLLIAIGTMIAVMS